MAGSPELNTAQVLIVEDDNSHRALLGMYFEKKFPEANVTFAQSVDEGRHALKASTDHPFGIVITDYNLPDGTGFDIANAAHELFPNIPVMLHTNTDPFSADELTNAGIVEQRPKGTPREFIIFVKNFFSSQAKSSS